MDNNYNHCNIFYNKQSFFISDGSPLKAQQGGKMAGGLGGLKKGEIQSSLPPSALKKPTLSEAAPPRSVQPVVTLPNEDQPGDCYLNSLYDQINELIEAKPYEKVDANKGSYFEL